MRGRVVIDGVIEDRLWGKDPASHPLLAGLYSRGVPGAITGEEDVIIHGTGGGCFLG